MTSSYPEKLEHRVTENKDDAWAETPLNEPTGNSDTAMNMRRGDDMLLGGHHYIAPLAMLMTPRFMAQAQDKELFTQLRGYVAKRMLGMMKPPPAGGFPELSGEKLKMLVSAMSGKADAYKQESLDKKMPPSAEVLAVRKVSGSRDVAAKDRDKFLKGLIVDSTGKVSVRRRARFSGVTYASLVDRYRQSAERISEARMLKGEDRVAWMTGERDRLEAEDAKLEADGKKPVSEARRGELAAKIGKLSKALRDEYAAPALTKLNTPAAGDKGVALRAEVKADRAAADM